MKASLSAGSPAKFNQDLVLLSKSTTYLNTENNGTSITEISIWEKFAIVVFGWLGLVEDTTSLAKLDQALTTICAKQAELAPLSKKQVALITKIATIHGLIKPTADAHSPIQETTKDVHRLAKLLQDWQKPQELTVTVLEQKAVSVLEIPNSMETMQSKNEENHQELQEKPKTLVAVITNLGQTISENMRTLESEENAEKPLSNPKSLEQDQKADVIEKKDLVVATAPDNTNEPAFYMEVTSPPSSSKAKGETVPDWSASDIATLAVKVLFSAIWGYFLKESISSSSFEANSLVAYKFEPLNLASGYTHTDLKLDAINFRIPKPPYPFANMVEEKELYLNAIEVMCGSGNKKDLEDCKELVKELIRWATQKKYKIPPKELLTHLDAFTLAGIYEEIKGKGCEEAVDYLERAWMDEGHLDAGMILAQLYLKGEGDIVKDSKTGISILFSLRDQGNLDAIFELAEIYRKGEDIPQDLRRAFDWYLQAAEKGHKGASDRLNQYFFDDQVPHQKMWITRVLEREKDSYLKTMQACKQSVKEMINWATQKNYKIPPEELLAHSDSFTLAGIYEEIKGKGCEEAVNYLERAWRVEGHLDAGMILAKIYLKGEGDIVKNSITGIGILFRLSEQGNSDAIFELAEIYRKGEDIPQDLERAFDWYLQAAEKGHKGAIDYVRGISLMAEFQNKKCRLK